MVLTAQSLWCMRPFEICCLQSYLFWLENYQRIHRHDSDQRFSRSMSSADYQLESSSPLNTKLMVNLNLPAAWEVWITQTAPRSSDYHDWRGQHCMTNVKHCNWIVLALSAAWLSVLVLAESCFIWCGKSESRRPLATFDVMFGKGHWAMVSATPPSCEGSGRDLELLIFGVISYHLHVGPVSLQTVPLHLKFLIAPFPTSEPLNKRLNLQVLKS